MSSQSKLQRVKGTLEILSSAAQNSPHAIALIGAGSAGADISRMDQYSDIDFFLIVEEGSSADFINDNSWFGNLIPIVFAFRDTDHGNKVLLENGVFLEFAIFTETELALYGISGLRTIWSRVGFTLPDFSAKEPPVRELSYYVNQALSNLLVGALRLRRGERLAALAMIERFALTNLLIAFRVKNELKIEDPFNIERRAELSLGIDFAPLVQGYVRLEESLLEILNFAESNFEVNPEIVEEIRTLI
jgi:lincosamide nucleotidyltransferase B/F